jgi:hypothetical protein
MFRFLLLVVSLSLACAETEIPDLRDKESMMDPKSCIDCHKTHYEEWSGSMHAYASKDPVFRAMNARMQRETNGANGDFCVKCHAPLAVALGLTTDGLNLDEVPEYAQGVTCFFCHTVESVEGTHNNPLKLADDLVMRGSYNDPVPNVAHESAYSPLLDRNQRESASLCGSCHDIVTPAGVHLERTFQEWQDSLFANEVPGQLQTCGNCHTSGRDDVAADYDGVFLRRVHDHKMVGADIALDSFPEMDAQLQDIQKSLDTTLFVRLCVEEGFGAQRLVIGMENMAAGHSWPSGATQDRRAWVEVIAYNEEGAVIFESGRVEDDQALTELDDPLLWRLGDRIYDEDGHEVHMFWEAASYESELLLAPTAFSPIDPAYIDVHKTRLYPLDELPARVTMRVRLRPMGLDILDDLVQSGDLDPIYRDTMPTFTLGSTELEWLASDEVGCVPPEH